MRSLGRTAGAALLLAGWATLAAAGEPGLHVERFGGALTWQGPQKVQADAKGTVFLLRGDILEVYPVLKSAALGKPVKLEAAQSLNGPVIDAAMGSGPGDWLLRLPLEVRWFVDGKEKALPPLPWKPWSVGYVRGTPVVGVLPQPAPVNGMEIRHLDEEPPSTAPAVMGLSGDRWSVLVEDARPAQQDGNSAVEAGARTVLGDRAGKLWTARKGRKRARSSVRTSAGTAAVLASRWVTFPLSTSTRSRRRPAGKSWIETSSRRRPCGRRSSTRAMCLSKRYSARRRRVRRRKTTWLPATMGSDIRWSG